MAGQTKGGKPRIERGILEDCGKLKEKTYQRQKGKPGGRSMGGETKVKREEKGLKRNLLSRGRVRIKYPHDIISDSWVGTIEEMAKDRNTNPASLRPTAKKRRGKERNKIREGSLQKKRGCKLGERGEVVLILKRIKGEKKLLNPSWFRFRNREQKGRIENGFTLNLYMKGTKPGTDLQTSRRGKIRRKPGHQLSSDNAGSGKGNKPGE